MNIFITGGTTGLGQALAHHYLQQGHSVAVCGRHHSKFEENFSQEDRALGRLHFYEVDVMNREKVVGMIEEFAQKAGRLDLIIANAGISMSNKQKIPQFERAHEVVRTNVAGVFHTFEGALQVMMKQERINGRRGHLVALGSVAGLVGLPGTGAYCASKAAVMKFCESLAIDLYSEGIDVTAIAPGFVDTPLTRQNRHPMPFLMSADKAAILMAKAISKRKKLFIFPMRMAIIMSILGHLPRNLYIQMARWGIEIMTRVKGKSFY